MRAAVAFGAAVGLLGVGGSSSAAPAEPRGTLQVCPINLTPADAHRAWAEGPSARAGEFRTGCVTWRVRPGSYRVGVSLGEDPTAGGACDDRKYRIQAMGVARPGLYLDRGAGLATSASVAGGETTRVEGPFTDTCTHGSPIVHTRTDLRVRQIAAAKQSDAARDAVGGGTLELCLDDTTYMSADGPVARSWFPAGEDAGVSCRSWVVPAGWYDVALGEDTDGLCGAGGPVLRNGRQIRAAGSGAWVASGERTTIRWERTCADEG
ncbi:MAG: hypothetical protein ACT4QF_22370 [Sporichthyaceae bacterium]